MHEQKRDLIQLRRMTRSAIAEIHAPRQRRGDAIGVIAKSGQEATHPPDAHAHGQWQHEGIATRSAHAGDLLRQLHGDQASEQRADNGLSFQQMARIREKGEGG